MVIDKAITELSTNNAKRTIIIKYFFEVKKDPNTQPIIMSVKMPIDTTNLF